MTSAEAQKCLDFQRDRAKKLQAYGLDMGVEIMRRNIAWFEARLSEAKFREESHERERKARAKEEADNPLFVRSVK